MSKVLRLHKEGDGLIDWTLSKKYGTDVIEQIEDPSGARADKEITSIPSPFARIDLAKSAFRAIGSGSLPLEGTTAYHKIVSDSLDIGELFFNYNRMSSKLDIIVWDRVSAIRNLETSSKQEHKMLGRTLEMYLDQDAAAYNFKNLKRIYLLGYKGKNKKGQIDIIGATSPCTLFFSSANNLSYMSEDLRLDGQDKPFDAIYTPLHKRDKEFQKYLWAFVRCIGEGAFAQQFPEFYQYLMKSYGELDANTKTLIDAVDDSTVSEYDPLTINGNTVDILGMPLHKSKGIKAEELDSDFKIKSKIYNGILPLALPVEEGNTYTNLQYIQDKWESTVKAPYVDSSEIVERTLPACAQKYPYVTISDFLQPSIISMPYPLNKDCFFNGNPDKEGKTYLLPLKDTFFQFFTVDELQGVMEDGKPMIEMMTFAGGSVKVTLRIPIQRNRYIEYQRKYAVDATPDEGLNEGGVVSRKFGLGVFPLIDFGQAYAPHYRIAFFNRVRGGKLSFAGEGAIAPKAYVKRRDAENELCSVESYVLEKNFDRIFVTVGASTNVIIPKFKKVNNASVFKFAIDFGTTNTHIEYQVDDEASSHPFDIASEEKQITWLNSQYDKDVDITDAFEDAFLPETIGAEDGYSFPIRTAMAEWKDINYSSTTNSLADCNIPFRYEKAGIPKYNKIQTDIKWTTQDKGIVELYLENLFLLLRNKVLLNGGRLADTKIVWFYPASMTIGHCNLFARIWGNLYQKYFGPKKDNLIQMSESVAPYYYYAKKRGAKSNVVTIDVGGGSTDVYVVADNEPKMLSSFRFAANSIFGDSYNFSIETNGFVKEFERDVMNILESNKLSELKKVYEAIKRTGRSEDVAAFFFSLKSNKSIIEKQIPMDFQNMLARSSKMKYVFIVFYGAILYYVANMMKAKGLSLPQTLAFSGNGSKTLNVLSDDNEVIGKFAQLIFEKVYGQKYGSGHKLDVIFDEEPKLATCKGGINQNDNLSYDEIKELRTSLLGTDTSTFAGTQNYNSIGKAEKEKIALQVESFIDFLFDLDKENGTFFAEYFIADRTVGKKVKETCKLELVEYTTQGYNKKLEELEKWGQDAEAEIEETMFFYPIVPMLNQLAKMLAE